MQPCLRSTLAVTLVAAAVSALAASGAWAQAPLRVTCVDPTSRANRGTCDDSIPAAGPLQVKRLAVRVDSANKPVAGASVHFYATSGRLTPDSTRTDAAGYASTTWYRDAGPAPAAISIDARSAGGVGSYEQIKLTVQDPAVQYGVRMSEGTDQQNGFEKAPLPKAIEVQLLVFENRPAAKDGAPVADREKCPNYRVAFAQFGGKGSLTPDTAVMWYDAEQRHHGCFAYANWTLPEGAGRRDAKATLIGSAVRPSESTVEFEAYARALPRIIGGVVATHYASYVGVRKGSTGIAKIERTRPDSSKITLDSAVTIARDTVQRFDAEWRTAAVIGVSTPLVRRWHNLSVTGGVDMNSPSRDWYFGVSVVRAVIGLLSESLPVDAHLLAHVGRSDVVRDEIACGVLRDCRTELKTRFQGFAGMISVDASALVGEVLKKIGI